MKIAKGDTVYLGDGTKCEYGNQVIGGGHLVYILSRLHEDAESDLFTVPQIVQEIYPSPPIAVKVEKVKELDQQISDRVTRLLRIQEELRIVESKRQELTRRIAREEAIWHVVDFLERRIKYLVFEQGYEYKLAPFEEALQEAPDRWRSSRGLKLLSLYGNLKGELSWGANSYSDGSGIETTVWPFHSLELARDFLQKLVEERADFALKRLNIHILVALERTYSQLNKTYGFDLKLPPAAIAAIRKQTEIHLKEELKKTEDKLQSIRLDLSSLEPPE